MEKKHQFAVVVLPHDKRIKKTELAVQLDLPANQLKFATEKQVIELGFPLGGVPPFGFNDEKAVRYFIHPNLKVQTDKQVFMGVGDNRKTLKLDHESFLKIVSGYEELAQD